MTMTSNVTAVTTRPEGAHGGKPPSPPTAVISPADWPARDDEGHEGGGAPPTESPSPEPPPVCELTRTGSSKWRVTVPRASHEFPRCYGLGCLARLTPRPWRSMSALDVYCSDTRSAIDRRRELHERGLATLEELKADGERGSAGSGVSYGFSFQTLIERPELERIRAKLKVIEDELETFSPLGSAVKQEELLEERYKLLEHLRQVVGRGGRLRRMPGDPAERARTKVKNAINRAYRQLQQASPEFGPLVCHLRASVKTGLHCVYQPKPPAPRWIVSP